MALPGLAQPGAAGGGSGDFLADGTVPMTGEFVTGVGTFQSNVADGASNIGFVFDAPNGATSGFKVASFKIGASEKVYIDKDALLYCDGRVKAKTGVTLTGASWTASFSNDAMSASYLLHRNSGPNTKLVAPDASHVPLEIRGAASQTGNLLDVRNDGGTLLAHIAANGDATFTASMILSGLPTSDPANAGELWNNAGVLNVSAG